MADEGFKPKLNAILSANDEGYSSLVGDDEESTNSMLTNYRSGTTALIQQHRLCMADAPFALHVSTDRGDAWILPALRVL